MSSSSSTQQVCKHQFLVSLKTFKPNSINVKLTYGYGSIPTNTIFRGMNIHKSQLFWCELQGYLGFWHTSDFIASKLAKPRSDASKHSKYEYSMCIVCVFVIRICHIYVLYIYIHVLYIYMYYIYICTKRFKATMRCCVNVVSSSFCCLCALSFSVLLYPVGISGARPCWTRTTGMMLYIHNISVYICICTVWYVYM